MRYFFGNRKIPQEQSGFLVRIDISALHKQPPLECEAFLIEAADPDFVRQVCQVIRGHALPVIHLRPIVLVLDKKGVDQNLLALADGHIRTLESKSVDPLEDKLARINQRIGALPGATDIPVTNVSLRMLRFLHVREKQAYPVKTISTKYGFTYPDLEAFVASQDETIFHLLDFLEEQGLLSTEFVEKAYFCNQCHSAFLNFQEVCPHCQSAHLLVDDLIHHFHCAYVGPSKEFRQKEQMVCPKCERKLQHIGVDFDKPSIVYTCIECSHVTQDPEISTTCYNCGRKNLPENQVYRTVYAYGLTALGENAAVYGLDSLFRSILDKTLPIIPNETFQTILQMELYRIERYKKSCSSLILLEMNNLDVIYVQYGSRAKEIFAEISTIMASILRNCDIITSLTDSLFLVLLVETPVEGAENALRRLQQQMDTLIEVNLQKEIQFTTRIVPLESDLSAQETISRITEHDTAE